ncbi:MAG: hypothetical protein ABR610_04525 [Thermoanaerobaculia bacterium]
MASEKNSGFTVLGAEWKYERSRESDGVPKQRNGIPTDAHSMVLQCNDCGHGWRASRSPDGGEAGKFFTAFNGYVTSVCPLCRQENAFRLGSSA